MPFIDHKEIIQKLSSVQSQIRWCDESRFIAENLQYVSPGGYLNPFGFEVIGTTIGGNAVVRHRNEPSIYFADHTWYYNDGISYEDLSGDKKWHDIEMNESNIRKSLFLLADSEFELLEMIKDKRLDSILDEID